MFGKKSQKIFSNLHPNLEKHPRKVALFDLRAQIGLFYFLTGDI